MNNTIKYFYDHIILKFKSFFVSKGNNEINSKIYINKIREDIISKGKDSYILDGYRVYSQFDEDGIIDSIFNDIQIKHNFFIEIGIGNGIENNTHFLILKNWKGIWIDSNRTKIDKLKSKIKRNPQLMIDCKKISPENIDNYIKQFLIDFNQEDLFEIDFLSIDIDSYDIECLKNLTIVKPRVICIEYNSKFPPDIKLSIKPSKYLSWEYDDYFGSSLAHINDILEKKGYKLISTNIAGINAFFVLNEEAIKCKTFNQTIKDLYMPPNYFLHNYFEGHRPTLKYLIDKVTKEV